MMLLHVVMHCGMFILTVAGVSNEVNNHRHVCVMRPASFYQFD